MDTSAAKERLPEPLSIQDQFSRRSVFIITTPDEEKQLPVYWLSSLMADDSNVDEPDPGSVSLLPLSLRPIAGLV